MKACLNRAKTIDLTAGERKDGAAQSVFSFALARKR
jgi:hypothetical protein